ncbi:MAG TPA: ComF family protein, partial [Psychrobacter sp.]|nr:ComF family protein [Psychrobacter sp.]
MHRLVPYQTGLWLAEYLNIRCQLCRIYRSTPQSQLLMQHSYANNNDASSENSELAPLSNQ